MESRPPSDDLALQTLRLTLAKIDKSYLDPSKLDWRAMFDAALNALQLEVPAMRSEPDPSQHHVTVTLDDQRQVFDAGPIDHPWRLFSELQRVFRFVESQQPGVDVAALQRAAINGLLSTLDPHSVLNEPEPPPDPAAPRAGVGLVIQLIDRKIMIKRTLPGGAARRAGLQAHDHLVQIDDDPTEQMSSEQAIERVRGQPGTQVTLWVERAGAPGLLHFDLRRALVSQPNVTSALLANHVGVVQIGQLMKGTTHVVADEMARLSSQGAQAWILDLRGNPGGLLEEAATLADLFVDSGTLTTVRGPHYRNVRQASRGGDTTSPLIVLVNAGTASGAELVTAALQALDRAAVVGATTFGSTSIQELFTNPDGNLLKLTVAEWLTPTARSVQGVGVHPDIALRRVAIPASDQGANGKVQLLEPTVSVVERDLAHARVSSDAHEREAPMLEIDSIGSSANRDQVDDLASDPDIALAGALAAAAKSASRADLLKAVGPVVAQLQADADQRAIASLRELGVDWAATPAAAGGQAVLATKVDVAPSGVLHAGELATVTATVTNTGPEPAWRVVVRLRSDDPTLNDRELPIGKIAPGETRSFARAIQIPMSAGDRGDWVEFEVRDAYGIRPAPPPVNVRIVAAQPPAFGYAYQLVGPNHSDGLVTPGARYRLLVTVENTGAGNSPAAAVTLRASNPGVIFERSRFELGSLAPGARRSVELAFQLASALGGDELELDLAVADSIVETRAGERIKVALRHSETVSPGGGTVVVRRARTEVHSGASPASPLIGWASQGGGFPVIGTVGTWTELDFGDRPGFVESAAVEPGHGAPSFTQHWQARPPAIDLKLAGPATRADHYSLKGTITDEAQVASVVVELWNKKATPDRRKIYYRANHDALHRTRMDFEVSVPLHAGESWITVVAQNASGTRASRVVIVDAQPR